MSDKFIYVNAIGVYSLLTLIFGRESRDPAELTIFMLRF